MHLFYLHAEKEQEKTRPLRTWFVIAESPFEALSFVPEGFSVKAAEAKVGAVSGPSRLIGWMGSLRSIECRDPIDGRRHAVGASSAVSAAHERSESWSG